MVVAVLAGTGWLLTAPHDLATLRILGVTLAWWAALAALAIDVAALLVGQPAGRESPDAGDGGRSGDS